MNVRQLRDMLGAAADDELVVTSADDHHYCMVTITLSTVVIHREGEMVEDRNQPIDPDGEFVERKRVVIID